MAVAKMWNGTQWVDVSSTPSNMMTLDTTQTITGTKDFTTNPTISSRGIPSVAGVAVPLINFGTITLSFSAVAAVTGTSPTFGTTYSATPTVLTSIQVGSNLDILVNPQSVTTTNFSYRAFNRANTAVTGTAFLHWMAIGSP